MRLLQSLFQRLEYVGDRILAKEMALRAAKLFAPFRGNPIEKEWRHKRHPELDLVHGLVQLAEHNTKSLMPVCSSTFFFFATRFASQ